MPKSDEIIDEILESREYTVAVAEETPAGIETTYQNKLIGNISLLLDSIQMNLSKVDSNDHIFVTRLIEVENSLRSLNDEINDYCDASNNVAMKDAEDGYVDFPDFDEL